MAAILESMRPMNESTISGIPAGTCNFGGAADANTLDDRREESAALFFELGVADQVGSLNGSGHFLDPLGADLVFVAGDNLCQLVHWVSCKLRMPSCD